jgi:hypothetical protein
MKNLIELIRETFLIELFRIRTKNYLFSFNLWIILYAVMLLTWISSMFYKLYKGDYLNFFVDLFLFGISFLIGYAIRTMKDR